MIFRINFIRSGMTESGREGKYLGRVDEPLCSEGILHLEEKRERNAYPRVSRLYTGGYARCRETANIIYPRFPALPAEGFPPFDYGDFTGERYMDFASGSYFAKWAESEEVAPFPGGEGPRQLLASYVKQFNDIVDDLEHCAADNAAIVTHRSVTLLIINRYLRPGARYHGMDILPGGGIAADYDSEKRLLEIKGCF